MTKNVSNFATELDILNGKTAYVHNEKITGTIKSQTGGIITPGTLFKKACLQDRYTSSQITLKGDANLLPKNIKSGVSIFGVEGDYKGSDSQSGTLPNNMCTISLEVTNPKGCNVYGGCIVSKGMTVTVRAEAQKGYRLTSFAWKENGVEVSDNQTYTFLVESSKTLTADFTAVRIYNINVNVAPPDSGTTYGSGTYDEGKDVTVTAYEQGIYLFDRWTENNETVSEGKSYTFTANSNRNLVAQFYTPSLPSGYTKIEYIQSDGNMGIDTGIRTPNDLTKVVIDVEPLSAPKDTSYVPDHVIFSSAYDPQAAVNTRSGYRMLWNQSGVAAHVGITYTSVSDLKVDSSVVLSGNTTPRRMTLSLDSRRKTASIDGVSKTVPFSSGILQSGTNLCLLLFQPASSKGLDAKIYSCQVYNISTLVRYFIPCVNPSSIAGLYDTVENTFYPSCTDTPFIAGPTI